WRRDYRHLARAIEHRAGPLSFGCYAEVATIRALEVDPSPGAWARAAALRDIILSPLPAPLAIPLGLDAGRAAFQALRAVAGRLPGDGRPQGSLHRRPRREGRPRLPPAGGAPQAPQPRRLKVSDDPPRAHRTATEGGSVGPGPEEPPQGADRLPDAR